MNQASLEENSDEKSSPNSKKFRCDICQRKFQTRRAAAVHKQTFDHEQVKCPVCFRYFQVRFISYTYIHFKNHHFKITQQSQWFIVMLKQWTVRNLDRKNQTLGCLFLFCVFWFFLEGESPLKWQSVTIVTYFFLLF